jgi:hypothetical protein
MQAASCVVCQERINLLSQKLITVQWVDGRSGALLSLSFHSDCYVRWYGENARSAQKPSSEAARKDAPLATLPPAAKPAAPAPAETPDRHLTPDELKRLESLRGRRDTDAAPSAAPDSGGGGRPQLEQRDDQHDQAPDDQQPEDGHDVAPPNV